MAKKESFPPPASHDYLKLENLEILELLLSFDLQLIPGNVIYVTGIIINEMMVLLNIGIENYRTFPERLHSNESLIDEKVQRVVHRSTGNRRALPSSGDEDVVRSRVCLGVQDTFNNGNPLRSWLNTALTQDGDSVFHRIRISSELDTVKKEITGCMSTDYLDTEIAILS